MARIRRMRVLRGEADTSTRRPMELWRGVYRSLHLVPAGDPTLPAAERRWEHLEWLVDALIPAAPAVVVLEDLHWADAMAVWVLEHLPRALGDARVAFVATSRAAEPDMPRLDTLRRVSRMMPLAGLDVDAVRRLAAAEAPGSVDAAGLHARTGGNPLFVKELVRSPGGSGVIDDVLQRSLDRFDAESAAVLATAAIAGAGARLSVLARACPCMLVHNGRGGRAPRACSPPGRARRRLTCRRPFPSRAARRGGRTARRCAGAARPAGGGVDRGRRRRRAGSGGRAPAASCRRHVERLPAASKRRARSLASWSPSASRRALLLCCGRPARPRRDAWSPVSCGRVWPSTWRRS